jgi:deoxyribodipyrimidine photo-lyase
MMKEVSIFWFRRDLRLEDNAGLWKALKSGHPVVPIFIFDTNILNQLEDKRDPRVSFLHQRLHTLNEQLKTYNACLKVFYGAPLEVFSHLTSEYSIQALFYNRDYEPYAFTRDKVIFELLKAKDINVVGAKDHVIFEKDEIVKADGTPYLVFSPYGRAWRKKLSTYHYESYASEKYCIHFSNEQGSHIPSLSEMGFKSTTIDLPSAEIKLETISTYDKTRNFPGIEDGTTRLGMHLRFGSVSVRHLLQKAISVNDTFINELIWRDFFQMALHYFPESREKAIKPKYDRIPWETNMNHFEAWCLGQTGYPMVDAGMRELNVTGYMHNRVRMIVASFLTKHLLIDWRLGERYFAAKLLDFDLASNIGGWQWASGSGLDAAPYFRIFNPSSQLEKFDKDLNYVKKWIPEYGTEKYPNPIVDHKWARERCLERFKTALSNG